MKVHSLFIVLIMLPAGCGYSPSNEDIVSTIDSALSVKSPTKFKVIDSSSSSAISGYIEEFEIEYSKEDYDALLQQVDSSNWKKVGNLIEYSKSDENGSGFIISLSSNRLRYQFGEQ